MSLKETKSTQHWPTIPKKCKSCSKAVYTIENNKEIYYQCSLYGIFKKDCKLEFADRKLPKPSELME